jgi:hypothetical protein
MRSTVRRCWGGVRNLQVLPVSNHVIAIDRRFFRTSTIRQAEPSIEADTPLPIDDQTDEEFATNSLEDTMVALVNAPPHFANTLRHQMVRQLLTTDLWVILREPPTKVERPPQPNTARTGRELAEIDEDMAYTLLELDLPHATRPTVPAFTSESRAGEAAQTVGSDSFEGVAVPGLQVRVYVLSTALLRLRSPPPPIMLEPAGAGLQEDGSANGLDPQSFLALRQAHRMGGGGVARSQWPAAA